MSQLDLDHKKCHMLMDLYISKLSLQEVIPPDCVSSEQKKPTPY